MKPSPDQSGRHVLDGALWGLLAQALMVPTGLITVAYLTRQLGPGGYGAYALAITIVTCIEFGITAFFSRAAVKFVSDAGDWRPVGSAVVRAVLVMGVLAMALTGIAAGPIARAMDLPELTPLLRLAALDIPIFVVAQAHLTVMIGLGRFRHRALIGGAQWIARMALILLLVNLGFSGRGAVLGCVGSSLLSLLACRLFCRPHFLGGDGFPVRRLLGYGVPLFLFAVSLRLFDGFDLLALKHWGGTSEQAGIYAAALNLALLPSLFAGAVVPLLIAGMSRSLRLGDDARARRTACEALRCVVLMTPVAALVAGSATEIATYFFGAAFTAAGPLLAVLLAAGMARLVINTAGAVLIAAGHPEWPFRLAGPLVPLGLIGYWLCIPGHGPIGAALVTLVVSVIGAAVSILAVRRLWGIAPPVMTLLRSAAVAVLLFAAARAWPAPGAWVVIKLAALTVAAGVSLGVLGEFHVEELGLLRGLLRRKQVALAGAGETT